MQRHGEEALGPGRLSHQPERGGICCVWQPLRTGGRRASRRTGFTLIELIAVVLILGVLAAVALPRFIDLRSDAERAAIDGYVGALRSARALAAATIFMSRPDYVPLSMYTFVQLQGEPSQPFTFDSSGVPGGHAIGTTALRNGVMDDPSADIWGPTVGTLEQFRFVTRTGRTVSITHDTTTGDIAWSASPSY